MSDLRGPRFPQFRALLKLAWPLIVSNSFWNIQLTIDRIFLGNYSTESLGAAMAVMGIFWTPMALLQQTVAYLTTFVAQYFGAREPENIGPATWQAIYLSIIGGFLFLFLIPFTGHLFALIGHPVSTQIYEAQYFDALCYSALPTAIVAAVSSFFSGLGNTKVILWINFAGMVSNVLFDYLMIFGKGGLPEMGIAGAGYATSLSAYISALIGLGLLLRQKHETAFRILSGWKIDPNLIRRFLRFGVPSGLQWALEGLAFSVFLIIVGRMAGGSAALASSSIVVTVMMLAVLPPLGLAQAVSIEVGQLLGQKNGSEAHKVCWSGLQLALSYILVVGSTFILFPSFYLSWFQNKQDVSLWNEVSHMVPILLIFVSFFTCFDCINFICSFTLKGAGDTRFVSLVALTLPWPLMVLPTWLLRNSEGAIYWAWGFAGLFSMTQAAIFFKRFRAGKWQTLSVIH